MPSLKSKNQNRPLIIAHRGGHYWKGNNFSYITESIVEGADIIELDIKLKDGEYVVQHDRPSSMQGLLLDALKKVKNTDLYLDIKDNKINPNNLITFVRKSQYKNNIIIGSFDKKLLKSIKRDKGIIINLHTFGIPSPIQIAKDIGADWINPPVFLVRKKLIKSIINNGFKFVPGGNFRQNSNEANQIRFAQLGAHVISTYNVKRMVANLKTLF